MEKSQSEKTVLLAKSPDELAQIFSDKPGYVARQLYGFSTAFLLRV